LLAPAEGSVVALGQDLRRMSRADLDEFRLRHSGFVFQSFNLFPGLSALEQVCAPLAYLGIGRAEGIDRAMRALRAVGLEHRASAKPAMLSGGEQQRVAIARAIAKTPHLLFADEPTSALDSTNGKAVTALLRQVARETGAVVLCVSHDPRVIEGADRVLHIQDGTIQADARRGLRAVAAEQVAR
jgi:putative ABC transport system ATP-binding protein